MTRRRVKDTDEFERAIRLRTLPFGIIAFGLVLAAGTLLGAPFWKVLVAAIIGGLAVMMLPIFFGERAGAAGASIYMSGGSSTPAIHEHSLAESLVARGMLHEAEEAYKLLAEDYPDDPEPATRLARLLRDKLARFEDAAEWFRKALAIKGISDTNEVALIRELSELYVHKLRDPGKALPYLARLSEKFPKHPAAQWARAEAAEIKQELLTREFNG